MHRFAYALIGLLLVACSDTKEEKAPTDKVLGEAPPVTTPDTPPTPAGKEPDRVTVDHILIGVTGALPRAQRSDADAKELAYKIVELLEGGANWDDLKAKYSEDGRPGQKGGPYAMANHGVRPDFNAKEASRGDMVSAFGDVGFTLAVGEIKIADYTPQTKASPFGYHIIKRIK